MLEGLRREDLFTVVHEQFPTDTVDYADIVLPATTQLEHFDIHGSYGHLYVQINEPAIAPLAEAKSNTDVFRLLARRMGFEPELFEVSDEQLAAEALAAAAGRRRASRRATAFDGHQRWSGLRREGPVRLNLPKDYAPFAEGSFGTPSGKCELYSPRLAAQGLDPLPTYTPPHEDPQTRPDLAARYPAADGQSAGAVVSELDLRQRRALRQAGRRADGGDPSRRRGRARHRATASRCASSTTAAAFRPGRWSARRSRPGVVVSQGIWWNKYPADGVNCNTTTSTRLTDLGGGATFFDNLVEVQPIIPHQGDDSGAR